MRLLSASILAFVLAWLDVSTGIKLNNNKIKTIYACFDVTPPAGNSTRRLGPADVCELTINYKKAILEVKSSESSTPIWRESKKMSRCKFQELASQFNAMGMHDCNVGSPPETACGGNTLHMEFRALDKLREQKMKEDFYTCELTGEKWGNMCGEYEHSHEAFMTTLSCVMPSFTEHCPVTILNVVESKV